jgi:hypothetical protein
VADRTNINFWVTLDHEPAPHELTRVQEIVEGYGSIDLNVSSGAVGDGGEWNVGGFYCEGIPDEADGIADELHEAFPDAVEVRCWDDPKYEWLGTLTVYRRGEPEARTASCDSNGTAVYTASEIVKVAEKTKAEHEPDPAIALMAVMDALRELEL